jgi:PAS domain S-box-containing protein
MSNFIVLFVLIATTFSFSQNPVVYSDDFESMSLDDILLFYEDVSGDLSVNDFLSSSKYKFYPLDGYKNLGFSQSAFWVQFRIQNKKKDFMHPVLILRANYPETYYIDFYQISEEGQIVDSSFTGTMRPVESRARPDENIAFFVIIPPNQTHTIYLRIESETPIMLDFSILVMDQYLKISYMKTLVIGLFIGILLLSIGYYSTLYIRIKDLSFLYLVLAGIALLFNFLASSQFAYIHLWPNYTYWNKTSVPLFDGLMVLLFIKFISEFLELKKHLSGWYRILNLVFILLIVLTCLVLFVNLYIISQLINVTIALTLILILPVSYLSFRSGYKPAKFFFSGLVLISPFGIYHLIIEFGLLPANNIGQYGYIVASIFLIWFFSLAVSERINLIKSDKEKVEDELHKSEKQLSLVIKGANLGTWDWDINTNKIICNEQCFEMLGMKNNEIDINLKIWKNLIHQDEKEKVLTLLHSHVKGKIPSYEAEYRIKRKSGKWIWVVARGKVIEFDNKGKPLHAAGTIQDITDRKRAEITQQVILNITNSVSTSKNMHEFYKTIHIELNKLVEAKNFQVALYDEKNDVILLPYRMDQFDKYEMIPAHKTCSAYVLKKKKAVLLRQADVQKLVSEGEIEIYGTPSKIWLGVPLQVDGKIIGLIFIQSYENENAYDEKDLALMEFVSEQIAFSIARKQSEEQIRILTRSVEQSPASIIITDLEGNIEYVNPKFTEVTGYTFDDVKGKNPSILKSDENPKELHKQLWNTISSGSEWKGEFRNKKKNGDLFWERAYIAPIKNEQGQITHYLAVKEDVTERKHTQDEMNKARNYINNILNSMPSIVIGINQECKVTHWNEEAEKMTGLDKEAATGHSLETVFPRMRTEMENIKKSIQSRQVIKNSKLMDKTENRTQYSDLTVYPLISNGIEGAVIRVDDVTERVRMEEMMIQSEKMLSVGGLAAGMAHEINNPLAGILQNTQVILNRLTSKMKANETTAKECGTTFEIIQTFMEKRKIIEMLEAINITGNRASKIVENMLSFSRKSESKLAPHDVIKILDDTVELAASDYDLKKKYDFRKIKIQKEYEPNIPAINCERSNMQQVFLNILRNGAQVMAENKEKYQKLERKEKEPCFIFRVSRKEDMVKIEIEDNGPGMDDETRRRVFEPFFTTKEVNEGTGLGLSVAYFIITEQHQGSMMVESILGKGTTFKIQLPVNWQTGE